MKTIHFLTGLPRSGNTVLSALLNQNPAFYSSPLSPLNQIIWEFRHQAFMTDNYRRNPNPEGLNRCIQGIFQNYYADQSQSIIFDRDKFWGTPANLQLIKRHVNAKPKIITTVRSITDILASYVSFSDNTFIDQKMMENSFYPMFYLPLEDARCDWLMYPDGDIDKALLGVSQALLEENKDNFLLVEYEDLINNPDYVMQQIYVFLEYKPYKHNFKKIQKLEKDDEKAIGHPDNIHNVRKTLSKTSKPVNEVLSQYVINKYSGMEFWRNKQIKKEG